MTNIILFIEFDFLEHIIEVFFEVIDNYDDFF